MSPTPKRTKYVAWAMGTICMWCIVDLLKNLVSHWRPAVDASEVSPSSSWMVRRLLSHNLGNPIVDDYHGDLVFVDGDTSNFAYYAGQSICGQNDSSCHAYSSDECVAWCTETLGCVAMLWEASGVLL